jgi:hydroxymethylbilane synthase
MPDRVLRIGTRGSALALKQADLVIKGLAGPGEIVVIRTSGDRFTDQPLGERNPVGFFTKEIEDELLAGKIDLAVHSLKDLPVAPAPGLAFGALLERDEPNDVLLVRAAALDRSAEIPVMKGAKIGASSRRRQALMGMYRPDLEMLPIRGNVTTRLRKAAAGDYDAILLSRAGLSRLALDTAGLPAFDMNPGRWPVAPGQAVIAVEARADDEEARRRVAALNHAETAAVVNAERGLLHAFGGGCHAPFGAYGTIGAGGTVFAVAAPDRSGGFSVRSFSGPAIEPASAAAEEWIKSGCPAGKPETEALEWLCRPARSWC